MARVTQGASVALTANPQTAQGDAQESSDLTLTIVDANDDVLDGFPVSAPSITHPGFGDYAYTFACPIDLPVQTLRAIWSGTGDTDDGPIYGEDLIVVLPHGTIVVNPALLTVAQFREHVATSLADAAVQRLLDANTLSINERAGVVGSLVRTITGHRDRYIFLDRPVGSITSILEFFNDPVGISGVTLDATDYRILAGGTMIERWGYGTHPGDWWSERVELTYVPIDDSAERIRVLLKLCQLDLNREPGLSARSIGDYSEQQRGEAYADEREAILASLVPSVLMFA